MLKITYPSNFIVIRDNFCLISCPNNIIMVVYANLSFFPFRPTKSYMHKFFLLNITFFLFPTYSFCGVFSSIWKFISNKINKHNLYRHTEIRFSRWNKFYILKKIILSYIKHREPLLLVCGYLLEPISFLSLSFWLVYFFKFIYWPSKLVNNVEKWSRYVFSVQLANL